MSINYDFFSSSPEEDLGIEVISGQRLSYDRPGLRAAKRLIDLAICICALPIILPVLVLCAIAVKLDDPAGPVLFVKERVGRGGRLFKMYKFRSMAHTASDDKSHQQFMQAFVNGQIGQQTTGEVFKPKAQVTRVGRFLRKTSLDELPQLINVLKGEMSIVGPRPNLPWEVEAYKLWHHGRLEVLPGITGLAQVHGRSSIPFEQIVKYDIDYVENMSLALDFKIMLMTAKVVLKGFGAR